MAGPFFSLPQHHRRLFKGCWSVLFTCPQRPSAAVWRRSKVQPWGAALHLDTKCNCLGAADGRPCWTSKWRFAVRRTYQTYIYIYRHHTVQVTILRPTTTTTTATTSTTTAQITMHAFSICATALGKKQTTSASYCRLGPAPAPFRPPLVPRSTCAQWWNIRTTSASYRGSKLHRHHWRARCSKHK